MIAFGLSVFGRMGADDESKHGLELYSYWCLESTAGNCKIR